MSLCLKYCYYQFTVEKTIREVKGFCPRLQANMQQSWDSNRSVHSTNASVQFSSVAQSCPTLCYPLDCSTPGLPTHHQLLELAQTYVHLVSDAIQPSHPLSSPPSPAFNLSQHQVFSSESVLCIRWPKYWSFKVSISPFHEYSGLISFRVD